MNALPKRNMTEKISATVMVLLEFDQSALLWKNGDTFLELRP